MKFKNEYLGYFQPDEEYEKAQLLWLWYDYHTEVFDRSLWGSRPSISDATMAALTTPLSHSKSSRNARKMRELIYAVSKEYNISEKTMREAKNDNYRNIHKIQSRMSIYLELEELKRFNFIERILLNKI